MRKSAKRARVTSLFRRHSSFPGRTPMTGTDRPERDRTSETRISNRLLAPIRVSRFCDSYFFRRSPERDPRTDCELGETTARWRRWPQRLDKQSSGESLRYDASSRQVRRCTRAGPDRRRRKQTYRSRSRRTIEIAFTFRPACPRVIRTFRLRSRRFSARPGAPAQVMRRATKTRRAQPVLRNISRSPAVYVTRNERTSARRKRDGEEEVRKSHAKSRSGRDRGRPRPRRRLSCAARKK